MRNSRTEIPTEALQALKDGNLIQAIKITRKKTGLSLKEAKDLLDQYMEQHPHIKLQIQNKLSQKSSPVVPIVIILLILAVLFWYFS